MDLGQVCSLRASGIWRFWGAIGFRAIGCDTGLNRNVLYGLGLVFCISFGWDLFAACIWYRECLCVGELSTCIDEHVNESTNQCMAEANEKEEATCILCCVTMHV